MNIKIDEIKPLPSRPAYPKAKRSWYRKPTSEIVPTVLIKDDKIYLLQGTKQVNLARKNSEESIECNTLTEVTEFEDDSMRITDEYFSSLLSPYSMGVSMREYREKYAMSIRDVQDITGLSLTTIHHYEILTTLLAPKLQELLDKGHLKFKAARSIAKIKDHERQYEIAIPFIENRLSSSNVEKILSYARKHPQKSFNQMIDELGIEVSDTHIKSFEMSSDTSESALEFAAQVENLTQETIPEYKKSRIISSLRIVKTRIEKTLDSLTK